MKPFGKIPEGWMPYSPTGNQIIGTRFIAFKAPLREAFVDKLKQEDRFTITNLLERIPELGLVIDLTQTKRYYNKNDVLERGVDYVKIPVPGQVVPGQEYVDRFFEVVDYYLDTHKDDDTLIGVHCTHGVNRTGYIICRYLIQRLGFNPEEAISAFGSARGHLIERSNYLDDLRSQNLEAVERKTSKLDLGEGKSKLAMRKSGTNKALKPKPMEAPRPPPGKDKYSKRDEFPSSGLKRGRSRSPQRGPMRFTPHDHGPGPYDGLGPGPRDRGQPLNVRDRLEPPISRERTPPPQGMRGRTPPHHRPRGRTPPSVEYMRGMTPPPAQRLRTMTPPPSQQIRGRSPHPPQQQYFRGRAPEPHHFKDRSPPPMRGRTPPPHMRGRSPPPFVGDRGPPHMRGGASTPGQHMRGVSPRPQARGRSPPPPAMRGRTPPPMRGRTPPPMRGRTPPPMRGRTPPPMRGRTPPPMRGRTPPPAMRGRTPPPMRGRTPPPSAMRGRTPPHIRRRSPQPYMRGRTPPLPIRGRSPAQMRGRTPPHMRGRTPPPHMRGRSPPPPMRGRTPPHMRGRSPPPSSMRGRSPPPNMRGRSPPPRDRSPFQQMGRRSPPPSYMRGRTPPGQMGPPDNRQGPPRDYMGGGTGPRGRGGRSPPPHFRGRSPPPPHGPPEGRHRSPPLMYQGRRNSPPRGRVPLPRSGTPEGPPPDRRFPPGPQSGPPPDYFSQRRDLADVPPEGVPYQGDTRRPPDYYEHRRDRSRSPLRREPSFPRERRESPPRDRFRRNSPEIRDRLRLTPPEFRNGRAGGSIGMEGYSGNPWDMEPPQKEPDCREILLEKRSQKEPVPKEERKRLLERLPPKNVDLRESLEEEKRRKQGYTGGGPPVGGRRNDRDYSPERGHPEDNVREGSYGRRFPEDRYNDKERGGGGGRSRPGSRGGGFRGRFRRGRGRY